MFTLLHANSHERSHSHHKKPATKANLSEIIIPSLQESSSMLFLPMLGYLSHQAQTRWLTYIGKTHFSKATATEYEFSAKNIRLMHSENDEAALTMMKETLSNGTSAFVVGKFSCHFQITDQERSSIELACQHGEAKAFIIKSGQAYH